MQEMFIKYRATTMPSDNFMASTFFFLQRSNIKDLVVEASSFLSLDALHYCNAET